MRYGRDFRDISRRAGRYGRDLVQRSYDIDRGYRRGGFQGSRMGWGRDTGFGGGGGGGLSRMGGGWSGTSGRFGGGGSWSAYGSGEMGVTLGNQGRGGPRRGITGSRAMRYDIGYGIGNDREWY